MTEHPAAVSLRAMGNAFGRLGRACDLLAGGAPYRHRTPSGTDCGMSVELPVGDAVFLANWLKGVREEHGVFWLCFGCGAPQDIKDVPAWGGARPYCQGCTDHARADTMDPTTNGEEE